MSVRACEAISIPKGMQAVAEAEDLQALTTTVQHASLDCISFAMCPHDRSEQVRNVVERKSGTPPADPEEQAGGPGEVIE